MQKVTLTFECINCRNVVTEKMHTIHAQYVTQSGGCCNACCKVADEYFVSDAYTMFEETESDGC